MTLIIIINFSICNDHTISNSDWHILHVDRHKIWDFAEVQHHVEQQQLSAGNASTPMRLEYFFSVNKYLLYLSLSLLQSILNSLYI